MSTVEIKNVQPHDGKPHVRRSLWCWLGLHDWYRGCFSSPVWGRYERHCLECDKKQHIKYDGKKSSWVTF